MASRSPGNKNHKILLASICWSLCFGVIIGNTLSWLTVHQNLKSDYFWDTSITCTRLCSDGTTIDAQLSCPDTTTTSTYCGDSSVQSPNNNNQYEQCDDGNSEEWDMCTNQCLWSTNYAIDTTNSWNSEDNNSGANNDNMCGSRMAQCGPDSFNPCETGTSSVSDSEATSWTCTLKDRAWNLCSGSSVSCGQSEPDDSVCECSETGRESLTDSEGNALVDESGNAVTQAIITCQSPINPATGNTKYANLNCSLRESTENRAALENARHQVDGSFGSSL